MVQIDRTLNLLERNSCSTRRDTRGRKMLIESSGHMLDRDTNVRSLQEMSSQRADREIQKGYLQLVPVIQPDPVCLQPEISSVGLPLTL